MSIELVLVTPDGEQRAFAVSRARIIGREEDCDLRVPVAEVSREHCRVEPSDNGGLAVEDLGSSNGTYINGIRIDEAEMAAGDVMKIGPAFMILRVDGDPASIDNDAAIERGTPSELEQPRSQPQTSKQVGQGSLIENSEADDSDMFSDFDFDDDDEDAPKL